MSNCRTVERPREGCLELRADLHLRMGPERLLLFQNGGPRAGDIGGASVGSPRCLKNLSMLAR